MSTGSINHCPRCLIPVPEELNNDSKLEEILWNFSRFDPERRLTLSQNPHFYNDLPTSSKQNWKEFNATATQENWHAYHTKPICVLTNTPGRVYLELCRNPRAFDNVWSANGTLIFKSMCLAFRFVLYFDIFSGVCGKLECEGGIVRTSIQHNLCSWCHVEHLSSEPGTAVVQPNQSSPSNNCVLVEKWIHELRRVLPWQNNSNVKIRISKCTEPTRGCGCSDSDEGSTESLERTKGVSSPTRGERSGGYDIMGSDEGSAGSLKRPEGLSSPTRGEWTGAHGVTAFSPLYLNALLVCLLSILVYLLFCST